MAELWQPSAGLEVLRLRAQWLAQLRQFFAQRQVLEVETPMLSAAAITDPNLHSFRCVYHGPGARYQQPLYLHTSPEFPMKRLLAAGSGCIYQLARVFRDGEYGRRHNPEFTLLEWYRVGFSHHQLMDEVSELVHSLLSGWRVLAAPERISYQALFQQRLGLDPLQTSVAELRACAEQHALSIPPGLPEDQVDPWLDLLLTHCLEPQLGQGRLCFVYDYPASQAALAQLRQAQGQAPVGERFELYLDGVELANGFHELADAQEQRARFIADNQRRAALGLSPLPLDEHFLAALPTLPECSGVALGFDRLLMRALGADSLAQVLSFDFERA